LWNSSNNKQGDGYKTDANAFIFSLINKDSKPIKMRVEAGGQKAIYCDAQAGPTFGGGHDFHISHSPSFDFIFRKNHAKLGFSYKHPTYKYDSKEAKCFLAGSESFDVSEIEVYQKI
jgi:hypothetical protein